MGKYLTKTIFKKSLNCPTSVYYYSKKDEYLNNEDGNEFLKGIAEGGYQVEYLAKDYYPDGVDMSEFSFEENINKTKQLLLDNENIILFEPLFIIDGYLARIDILEKKGDVLKIIEVKAKSFDFIPKLDKKTKQYLPLYSEFLNKRSKIPTLKAAWDEYIYDVLFQKYILMKIYPNMLIESNLFLLDKNKKATVNGLHQKYLVRKDNSIKKDNNKELGESIMGIINLDELFEILDIFNIEFKGYISFESYLEEIRDSYLNEFKINSTIGNKCSKCPLYVKEEKDGEKSGYLECWEEQTKKSKEYIKENQTILEIWNYRSKDKLINDGVFFINETQNSETYTKTFNEHEKENSNAEIFDTKYRQLTQVNKVIENDKTPFFFVNSLKDEMDSWNYPLNFIDFETSAVALPFNEGITPYESVGFQFSHHIMNEDGSIEHKSEYLHSEIGTFPSFEFVRALKNSLEENEGSIFIYSQHENSILNHIFVQLVSSDEEDKNELMSFIQTITKSNKSTMEKLSDNEEITSWEGNRLMVDLLDVVKKMIYMPYAKGSNSIKYILPAFLNFSDFLKEKYSKPIYGTNEFPSKNYKNMKWVEFNDDGDVINPYELLPGLEENDKNIYSSSSLNNGGNALIAYSRLQFSEMDEKERKNLQESLLRYCELDTLAMCMIVESLRNDI